MVIAAFTMLMPLMKTTTGWFSMRPVTKVTPLISQATLWLTRARSAFHSGAKAERTAVRGAGSERAHSADCADGAASPTATTHSKAQPWNKRTRAGRLDRRMGFPYSRSSNEGADPGIVRTRAHVPEREGPQNTQTSPLAKVPLAKVPLLPTDAW